MIKARDKIIKAMESTHDSAKINKRLQSVTYGKIDKALLFWFRQKVVLPSMRIYDNMLLAKLNEFVEYLRYESKVYMDGSTDPDAITPGKFLNIENQQV